MTDSPFTEIVKAYDVRGVVPEQLNEELAFALGAAFADELVDAAEVVIGFDMRESSPGLAKAFGLGLRSRGVAVRNIGLASTDLLYFASGHFDLPGVMVTASHNPAQYNGFKLCRAGAKPIGYETGLGAIAAKSNKYLGITAEPKADETSVNVLDGYVAKMHQLVPISSRRRLKVVVDAANGMAGHTVPAAFASLNCELVEMYFELDGSFPNHEANPLEPDNLKDLQAAVVTNKADLGLAFDGDADRCFVVDEKGDPVSPSLITALIAKRLLQQNPGATVLYNSICSDIVPETIAAHGGKSIRTPVGHSLIKAVMAKESAVFGGEHSGHYYFADFYGADSGMLAALHVMSELADSALPLSQLVAEFDRYFVSGEINRTVKSQSQTIARIKQEFADRELDELDGLTVRADDWWFNVRASNTEPLLRLNVEANDGQTLANVRDYVLSVIEREE